MALIFPDYHHSLLNIVGSIQKYYCIDYAYPPLKALEAYLEKQPTNIVLIVMDGMGVNVLEAHLAEDSFLRSHLIETLTSVYPCTTTAAMTSYYSGLSPLEHGWIGWSLYFKEYGRTIDTFLNLDTYDKQPVGTRHAAHSLLDYKTIFDYINEGQENSAHTYTVMPEGIEVAKAPNINLSVEDLKAFGEGLNKSLQSEGNKYVMGYWYEPDLTIHKTGCYSKTTAECIRSINTTIETLVQKSKDTLFIISADHGLTDIIETLYLDDFPDIEECLMMPPFIEPRCSSFYIKNHKKKLFEERFKQHFGHDFLLMSRTAFLDKGYLGSGTAHKKVDDFIGDYIAIGTGQKLLKYRTANLAVDHDFKGHHAGLRPEEMLIPLIVTET